MGADERWGLRCVDKGCGEFAGLIDAKLALEGSLDGWHLVGLGENRG